MKTRKEQLRTRMRRKIAGLKARWIRRAGEKAQKLVIGMAEFRDARVVSCYVAMPRELNTRRIVEACLRRGKRLCVPVWRRDRVTLAPAVRIDAAMRHVVTDTPCASTRLNWSQLWMVSR